MDEIPEEVKDLKAVKRLFTGCLLPKYQINVSKCKKRSEKGCGKCSYRNINQGMILNDD